jgi:hypothetical protein
MSRLEASGTVTPSQREDAREEYKALFAQLKKLWAAVARFGTPCRHPCVVPFKKHTRSHARIVTKNSHF